MNKKITFKNAVYISDDGNFPITEKIIVAKLPLQHDSNPHLAMFVAQSVSTQYARIIHKKDFLYENK